jgi:hypothetical protein
LEVTKTTSGIFHTDVRIFAFDLDSVEPLIRVPMGKPTEVTLEGSGADGSHHPHRAAGLVNRHRSAIGKAWRSSAIVLLQLWSGIPEKNRKIRSRWPGWDLVETSSDKASVVRRVIDDMQNHFATRHCAFPTADKIEANNFL